MVLKEDKKEKFVVNRTEEYGGNLEYENYKEIEKDFVAKKLHPLDLKNAAAKEINNLLRVIHKKRKELERIAEKGYS